MHRVNIDQIYESAFIPEAWPDVLGRLGKIAGALGGGLFIANGEVTNWTASSGLEETMTAFVNGKVLQAMARRPRLYEAGQHSFVTEGDVFSEAELDEHPLYRDFLRPRGLGWSARTSVRLPTGDNIILTVERALNDGPVPAESLSGINFMRPHLARAALISARLQLERAKAATETLAMLGLPALVFDSKGRVLGANALIEKLKETIVFRAHEQVALIDVRANSLLKQAIETASRDNYQAPYSFSVCDSLGVARMVAHVIPVRGQSRDIFVRCAGVLTLTPITSVQMPSVDLVQSLFDFTPAEAKVARFIAQGETVEDIALTNDVSVNTIRAQVRSVLDKTGCKRQIEVATLLSGISVIRDQP
jgi:DNA-binding CsgD family transcriptional regulator